MDENIDINAVKPLDRHWMLTNDLHMSEQVWQSLNLSELF